MNRPDDYDLYIEEGMQAEEARYYEDMEEFEYLQSKRIEVLKEIAPICEAFNISDYDYIVKPTGHKEILRIGEVEIGCSLNSIDAVIDELIGYIFITRWCKRRYLGAFSTQAKNVIKQYWI